MTNWHLLKDIPAPDRLVLLCGMRRECGVGKEGPTFWRVQTGYAHKHGFGYFKYWAEIPTLPKEVERIRGLRG